MTVRQSWTSFEDLLPEGCGARLVGTSNIKELLFLGQPAIRAAIRIWRRHARDLARTLKLVDEMVAMTAAGRAELWKRTHLYDYHTFGEGDIWVGDNVLIPFPEHWSRLPESTTLNHCGWCKYAVGEIAEFGAMRNKPVCGILQMARTEDTSPHVRPELLDRVTANPRAQELLRNLTANQRHFFSSCWIGKVTQYDVEDIEAKLREVLAEIVQEKSVIDNKIRFLAKLEADADVRPVLPIDRDSEYLSDREQVMLFSDDTSALPSWVSTFEKCWLPGQVSIFRREIRINLSYGGEGNVPELDINPLRPQVMRVYDWKLLREDPDFARLWVKAYDAPNYDPEPLLAALLG
jgi:hypothetical protein